LVVDGADKERIIDGGDRERHGLFPANASKRPVSPPIDRILGCGIAPRPE
jgi:hypothetical protein